MRKALTLAALLTLSSCATVSLTPPPDARQWSGPESEVIAAVSAEADPGAVLTFRYSNGAYLVVSGLHNNMVAPDS